MGSCKEMGDGDVGLCWGFFYSFFLNIWRRKEERCIIPPFLILWRRKDGLPKSF